MKENSEEMKWRLRTMNLSFVYVEAEDILLKPLNDILQNILTRKVVVGLETIDEVEEAGRMSTDENPSNPHKRMEF